MLAKLAKYSSDHNNLAMSHSLPHHKNSLSAFRLLQDLSHRRQKRPREKRVSVKDFKEENRQTLFQSDHQTEEGKVTC